MKALITGATGFVGSAVVRAAIAAGVEARALARPASDRRNLDGLPIEVVEGDLTDRGSLDRALADCRGLYHVAADYRLWAREPATLYRCNVEGTRNVMEAALAAGIERIVYCSSVATLGLHADGRPADEETEASLEAMISPYKRSKYLAEAEVVRMIREQDLPCVIVHPTAPVGPRDIKPTPTGRMVLEAAMGRMPAYVDTGLNIVHVDDVARGHLLAYEKGGIGAHYILGGEDMSLRDILVEIAGIAGCRPPRFRIPHDVIMPIAYAAEAWTRVTGGDNPFVTVDGVKMAKKRMYFSSAKARRELGYDSRPAREALVDAVAWFRDNGYCR